MINTVLKCIPPSLLVVVALGVNAAHALNAEGYLNIQRDIQAGGKDTELHRAFLSRYLQGLAEAFGAVYTANNSLVPLRGNPHICAPNAGVFTTELMEVAIQQQIGTFRSPKPLEKAAKDVPLGFHAMLGLATLFPCK